MKYFSYDPTEGGYGFEIHDTAKAAKARAQQVLDDFFYTGWDDQPDDKIEGLYWGKIKGEFAKVMDEPNEDGVMAYNFILRKVE